MARPKKNPDLPDAQERMEVAFWDLLAEKPYARIMVKDVLERSQVTRTSFYYHYGNMKDLADAAITHEAGRDEAVEVATRLISGIRGDSAIDLTGIVDDPALVHRFNRLVLLAGPHGTPELMTMLKDFIRVISDMIFQMNSKESDMETKATVEFVIGGVMALLSMCAEHPDTIHFSEFAPMLFNLGVKLSASIQNGRITGFWE